MVKQGYLILIYLEKAQIFELRSFSLVMITKIA